MPGRGSRADAGHFFGPESLKRRVGGAPLARLQRRGAPGLEARRPAGFASRPDSRRRRTARGRAARPDRWPVAIARGRGPESHAARDPRAPGSAESRSVTWTRKPTARMSRATPSAVRRRVGSSLVSSVMVSGGPWALPVRVRSPFGPWRQPAPSSNAPPAGRVGRERRLRGVGPRGRGSGPTARLGGRVGVGGQSRTVQGERRGHAHGLVVEGGRRRIQPEHRRAVVVLRAGEWPGRGSPARRRDRWLAAARRRLRPPRARRERCCWSAEIGTAARPDSDALRNTGRSARAPFPGRSGLAGGKGRRRSGG